MKGGSSYESFKKEMQDGGTIKPEQEEMLKTYEDAMVKTLNKIRPTNPELAPELAKTASNLFELAVEKK
jgi:hypothetical protein